MCTYATKTKQQPPLMSQKNQGILVAAIDGVPAIEYVYAIANLVKPQNILFFNKISHNRISIYLSKKEIVDKLINDKNTITIYDQVLEIRRQTKE